MKKYIITFIAAALVLSLAACRTTGDAGETTASETEKETVIETEQETEEATETEAESDTASEAPGDTVGEPDNDTTPSALTQDEALAAAKAFLGDVDPDTGYKYSVQFESAHEGSYTFRVSWYLEEDERYSYCGKVVVDPEGNVSKFDW